MAEHEIYGIAILASRVIQAMFPSVEYCEGCKAVLDGTVNHSMIVSPDGSLREPMTNRIIIMYKNKCKIENYYRPSVNQYFVHILSLATQNKHSCISGREENGCGNYFRICFRESTVLGRDQTNDPWICSQIHYCTMRPMHFLLI